MASEFSWQMADSAQEDFDHIVGYLVRKLRNSEAATAFADDLTKALDDLCAVPLKGPWENGEWLKLNRINVWLIRRCFKTRLKKLFPREMHIERGRE